MRPGSKRCSHCREEKPIGEFHRHSRTKDGRQTRCKVCKGEASRKYYESGGGREKQKKYREKNKARLSEYKKKYYSENKERILKWFKANYGKNRDAAIARVKEWTERNPEKRAEWRRANQARYNGYQATRRAKERAASIGDKAEIAAKYTYLKTANRLRCTYCKKVVAKRDRHVDHIIPLSRGGTHEASNLCCSCSRCNLSKHTKTPEEFTGQMNLRSLP